MILFKLKPINQTNNLFISLILLAFVIHLQQRNCIPGNMNLLIF